MPIPQTVRQHPSPNISESTSQRPSITSLKRTIAAPTRTAAQNKNELDRHLKRSHRIAPEDKPKYYTGVEIAPFYGTECLHSDCAEKQNRCFYPTEKQYTAHLRTAHKLAIAGDLSAHQLWRKLKNPQDQSTTADDVVEVYLPTLGECTVCPALVRKEAKFRVLLTLACFL